MSTMRNAVHRRNHQERAQPQERAKWGLLEKHKDYTLRAKAFAAKKTHLRHLRAKASERNPDEFAFSMVNAHTHKGVKIADRKSGESLSQDVVRLLKTQDAGYLRVMLGKVRRERERLEGGSIVLGKEGARVVGGEGKGGKHTAFVEGSGEQEGLDVGEWFGVEEEKEADAEDGVEQQLDDDASDASENDPLPPSPSLPSRTAALAAATSLKSAQRDRKKRFHAQQVLEARVRGLRARERELAAAEREVGMQRARMGNAVGGVNRDGVKWKVRERKR
ncbi:U3 small nucleolar RNA-associated protein 11 [Eremomyces bilateralis CBS 781.70]|uniref:U3 small nucleolar RNA-associated protein 11 n=1 Tax=Eremomyces bilateralis CBS 781.70 TaxID=1392243 RepID=A0A6G1FZX5_9PEZI|nr:U3 small nucleolar RNA-associated protein 11 [Eremomyces bilateralis CBS 781.70]KAF1811282.1 U3 small nucleolar RNA-associated protein 11 [Eremomyces bilateralis CBS 781.70]